MESRSSQVGQIIAVKQEDGTYEPHIIVEEEFTALGALYRRHTLPVREYYLSALLVPNADDTLKSWNERLGIIRTPYHNY